MISHIKLHRQTMFKINSLREQPAFHYATNGFPANDVWETSAEIPY